MLHKILNPNPLLSTAQLIFLGWSTDENALTNTILPPNTIALFDYSSTESAVDLSPYTSLNVIAWSMGVWAAEHYINKHPMLPWHHTVAIGGTPYPIDNSYGIPPSTIQATLDNWSDTSRTKFNLRMCGGKKNVDALNHPISLRSIESQKAELKNIIDSQKPSLSPLTWDTAYIGLSDKIFPVPNMQSYWQTHATTIHLLNMPHWQFGVLTDLTQI